MLVSVLGMACSAAGPENRYYVEGPLRGSLKSDGPLPLYDPSPEHLWNRLFAAFYIRPTEIPSRPKYPDDPTQLSGGPEHRPLRGCRSGEIRTYSRADRTVRWKLGQEDYLRLVEYARGEPAARSRSTGK
jgi:hypothetical protein